jgi:sulfatase maturation enzyme AslB (radical SAM superfamily)
MRDVFSIQVLTNLSCNLACDYCYEKKYNRVNDADTVKRFMNYMFDKHAEKSVCELEFIGGESFLCVDLLDELTDYARTFGKKMFVSLTTNGTLLGKKTVRDYIEKNKDVLRIGVSIDGVQELHDTYRKHKNGKGSYSDIVPHIDFLFKALGRDQVGVKATFTKETFQKYYYRSILHLIGLGFKDISGNIMYEENVDAVFGLTVAREFMRLADYFLESDLYKTVKLRQLNPDVDFIRQYNSRLFKMKSDERNYCGSCNEMTCIGFDGLAYGCNRFCTMGKEDMHIGKMEGDRFVPVNSQLKAEVMYQYKRRPQECQECVLNMECPACVAIPYEYGNPQEFVDSKGMCGWTHGVALARFYMCTKLFQKESACQPRLLQTQ